MSTKLGIVAVRSGHLMLREQPSTSSPIRARLLKGRAVQILASEGAWYHVSVGNQEGYVSASFIHVQDDDPEADGIRSLLPNFDGLPIQRRTLVRQALQMLGEDAAVFDSLPQAQQQDCWGWQYRHDLNHFHHKDVVCADLVYICLKSSGVQRLQWTVKEPSGTAFNTPHAANYFRPSEVLRPVPDAEAWQPGDILIYWDGDLLSHRLLHVNLYVGPFAGVDLDGRVYAQDQPCDVVNASIDYRDRRGQEVGTRIRGLTKDNCLQTKLGRKNIMRLRHIELDGQPQAGVPMVGHDGAAVATERLTVQPTTDNDFIVPAGQLTFEAEGQEVRGLFFSRTAHVPSNSSGVTLGRGYDMKMKTRTKILGDLTNAGIDAALAARFAGAVGLQGRSAKQYLHDQGLDAVEITPAQQKALFLTTYEEHAADVKRICATNTVVRTYGRTAWDQLHPTIQDVVVDLRYRGDYTPNTRQRVQPLMVANDLSGMARVIGDKAYWQNSIGVPHDRFERRADYMARALHAVG